MVRGGMGVIAATVALVALLAGCTSVGDVSPSPTPSVASVSFQGWAATNIECPTRVGYADWANHTLNRQLQQVTNITSIVVCYPGPHPTTVVLRPGDSTFYRVVAVLQRPNETLGPNQGCVASWSPPEVIILATTAAGSYMLDSARHPCGAYIDPLKP
jgi:hypothetical protein